MNGRARPYRFLTFENLTTLSTQFSTILSKWNHKYSKQFINYKLLPPQKFILSTPHHGQWLLKNDDEPLAILSSPLPLMKDCLFNDSSTCFNQVCDSLFLDLMQQLFERAAINLVPNISDDIDLFYPNISYLLLFLTTKKKTLRLYLHPSWVSKQIPLKSKKNQLLVKINDSFLNQKLTLTLTLKPMLLSSYVLTSLKVGDVIKTDHSIKKALILQQGKQTLAQAYLGKVAENKSIQLLRL